MFHISLALPKTGNAVSYIFLIIWQAVNVMSIWMCVLLSRNNRKIKSSISILYYHHCWRELV